jgi:heptosyltransferase-2
MPAESILVRLPNPLGDAIMATPFLQTLQIANPQAEITVAGSSAFVSLFSGLPSIHQWISLPENALHGIRGVRRQAALLRQAKAQRIYLLPNSISSALAARLAQIPERIGRRSLGRRRLLTQEFPTIRQADSMTVLYNELLGLGNLHCSAPVHLPSGDFHSPFLQEIRQKIPPGKGLAVSPGASFSSTKCYPASLLADVLEELHNVFSWYPILLGSPEEKELLQSLSALLQKKNIAHISTHNSPPSLLEAKEVYAICEFALTMDSGARHLAAAVGTPHAVFYGPTDMRWSQYEGPTSIALRNDALDCLGCHKKICPIGHPCMKELSPKKVVEAIKRGYAMNHCGNS